MFLLLRWLWTPYPEMADLLPKKGRILDGGCGHGLLSLTLALRSGQRKVLGIDHSAERISAARRAGKALGNLSFSRGDFRSLPAGTFQGFTFVDVLHYLSYEDQTELLQKAFHRLGRGGILLFRDVDRRPGFASFWNRLHEGIMTRLGFTKAGGLHFRSRSQWAGLARQTGFRVRSRPTGRFPFADVLFFCQKP